MMDITEASSSREPRSLQIAIFEAVYLSMPTARIREIAVCTFAGLVYELQRRARRLRGTPVKINGMNGKWGTYQPAALDSAADSINGVSTHGFGS